MPKEPHKITDQEREDFDHSALTTISEVQARSGKMEATIEAAIAVTGVDPEKARKLYNGSTTPALTLPADNYLDSLPVEDRVDPNAKYPYGKLPQSIKGGKIPDSMLPIIDAFIHDSPEPELTKIIVHILEKTFNADEKKAGLALSATQKLDYAHYYLKGWLEDHGYFVFSTESDIFYFYEIRRKLFDIDNPVFAGFLVSVTGVNATKPAFKSFHSICKTTAYIQNKSPVYRVAYYNTDLHRLYLSGFEGEILCITAKHILAEGNGQTVLFNDKESWQGYDYRKGKGDGKTLDWFCYDFPYYGGDKYVYGLMFKSWIMTIFFPELCPTKAYPLFWADADSGKSTMLRMLAKFMFGDYADVASPPAKLDAFRSAAASNHLLPIDNLDEYQPWMRDEIAVAATGGEVVMRKLYETNMLVSFMYRVYLAFTARTPDTMKRDDLVRRALIIPLDLIPGKLIQDFEILQLITEKRDDFMADIIRMAQRIIAEIMENGMPTEIHWGMGDYDAMSQIVAKLDGKLESYENMIKQIKSDQADLLLEGDILIEAVKVYLSDRTLPTIEMTNFELYHLLKEALYGSVTKTPGWPDTPRKFSAHLISIRKSMRVQYGFRWRKGTSKAKHNVNLYWFEPM